MRTDTPATRTTQGDQLSAEREMRCPPTGRLACPLSEETVAVSKMKEICSQLSPVADVRTRHAPTPWGVRPCMSCIPDWP